MAKWLRGACMLLLAALTVAMAGIFRQLPAPGDGELQSRYARWSGVLRLWVCEGWESGSGSLSAWLNRASSRFEKAYDGAYVHVTYVSRETLRAFNYAAENPPDMLLFAPGMLDGPDDLLPTEARQWLRADLREWANACATPVAMGGYAWAINRSRIPEGLPDNASIALPEDAQARCFSAALAALLTGNESITEKSGPNAARYGVDLGLPVPTQIPNVQSAPAKRRELFPGSGSERSGDAYARFARGDADALVVTQREIRKLQLLSEAGRAPDWEIAFSGEAFTDQLALIGIVDLPRESLTARQELCEAFVKYLLSDPSQAALSIARAFRVTDGPALYPGQSGMAQMEQALAEHALLAPGAFDTGFSARAARAADAILRGEGGAMQKLTEALACE